MTNRHRLRPALLVSWSVAVVLAVVVYADGTEPLRRAALNAAPLVVALLYVAGAAGLGWPLASRVLPPQDRSGRLLAAAALGLGMCGLFVLGCGLLGRLDPRLLAAPPALGLLLGLLGLGAAAARRRSASGQVLLDEVTGAGRAPAGLDPAGTSRSALDAFAVAALTGAFVLVFPFVLAPEVTTDALEFHLLVPRLYLILGRIEHIPGLVESNYPSLAEYLFLPLLAHGQDIACKCLHFVEAALAVLAVARLHRLVSPPSTGLLSAALFFTMPVALLTSGWAWNDLLFTLFVVLAVHELVAVATASPPVRGLARLALASTLAGFASLTKYTFALPLFALLSVLLVALRRSWLTSRQAVAFLAPAAALSSIWVVKNWAFTGNPVYPFLNAVFGSPFWTDAAQRYFHETLTRYEIPDWSASTYLLFPLKLALRPRVIDVHTGVLPLLLLPFVLLPATPAARLLRTYAAAFVIAWLLVQTETRSMLTLLAALVVLGVAGLELTLAAHPRLRAGVLAALGIATLANLAVSRVTTEHLFHPVRFLFGLETKAAYVARASPEQPVYDWLDREPSVERVLLVGLHGPFYLRRSFLFSSCCDPPVAESLTAGAASSADLRSRLRALDVTHVAIDREEYERENAEGLYTWDARTRRVFEDFLERRCRPVAAIGRKIVFELGEE